MAAIVSDVQPPPSEGPAAAASGDFSQLLRELATEINATAIRLKRSYRSSGAESELRSGGASVLELLERTGALTVPQMARARGTSRQNIQVLVNRLVRKGWLGIRSNPGHKRSPLLSLTPGGKALVPRARQGTARIEKLLRTSLSFAEMEAATLLLRRIRLALSDHPAGAPFNRPSAAEPDQTNIEEADPPAKRAPLPLATHEEPAEEAELPVNLL